MDPIHMTAPTDFTPTLNPETAVSDQTLETDQLLGGTYVRTGMDLTVSHPDSETVTLPGYFDSPVALSNGGGLVLTPDMVTGLAHAGTPLTVAQAGEADAGVIIGQIEEAQGSVTVQRLGEELSLGVGDNVWLGDVVSTDDGGAVGLRLADETQFTIAGNSRMILDEFVYDPGAGVGNVSISVVQGAFSFISGQASGFGADAMQVNTPVGTIGIRGTQVIGEIDIGGQTISIVLVPEADGSVGQIAFQNAAGEVILSAPFEGITNASVTQLPTPIQFENLAAVSAFLGSSFETLDNFTRPPSTDPTDPNNGTETTDGTEDDDDTTSSDDDDEDEETENEDDDETTSEDEPSPDDVTNDIANQIIAALNTTPTEDTAPEVPTTPTTTPETNPTGGSDSNDPSDDDDDNSDEDARLLALQAAAEDDEDETSTPSAITVTLEDATFDGEGTYIFTDENEYFVLDPTADHSFIYYEMRGGNDTVLHTGNDGFIYGGADSDTLTGTGSGIELYGDDGDDVLSIGGMGQAFGGNGNDTIFISSDDDYINVYGGSGTDTLDFSDEASGVDITLYGTNSYSDVEVLELSEFDDLVEDVSFDTIFGNGGNDAFNVSDSAALFGGSGDDFFVAENNSTLFGGSGGDSFELFDEYASGISIAGGSETDTLLLDSSINQISFTALGNFSDISGVDNIYLKFNTDAEFSSNLIEGFSDNNQIVITAEGSSSTITLPVTDFFDISDPATADADANAILGTSTLDFNVWSNTAGTVTLYVQDNIAVDTGNTIPEI